MLLDLSTAFDTTEHSVIIKRLEHTQGIKDTALDWMRSYFQGRTQAVVISGASSDITTLERGVPQGSVIGPKGYSMYTQPLGAILRKHHMDYAIYADDTQCYTLMKPNADWNDSSREIEECYQEIHCWMSANFLRLNDEKTERDPTIPPSWSTSP